MAELKILKEDYAYYVIDQSQSVNALTNYHKNKRIDKYLEYSSLKEIKLKDKVYHKKDYLSAIEFKVLYGIQKTLEGYISELNIIGLNGNAIQKRLIDFGDKMKVAELKLWRTEWNRLQKENDAVLKKIELKTDEARETVLKYCFKIDKKTFEDNYTQLVDYADGVFFTAVNLFDTDDPTRVKDVIAPLIPSIIPNPNPSLSDTQKKLKGID